MVENRMNPEGFVLIGVLVYFATIASNRYFSERNYASLSSDEKLKLVDAFSKQRSLATYLPIGIMLLVLALGYSSPRLFFVAFPIGVVLCLAISAILRIAVFRRLRQLSLPNDYVARAKLQSTLVQWGTIIALSLFTYGIVASQR